jgi:hypothetical protein
VPDPAALGRFHFTLRFATGLAVGMALAEAMGWKPTFLVPALVGTLLASVPISLPFKAAVGLLLVVTLSGLVSFLLASLLIGVPHILFGAIGLIVFATLATMASGKARVPGLLLLLCITVVPVIAIIYPAQAAAFPIALVRATAAAIGILWCMHALWPRIVPPAPQPPPVPVASPAATALMGSAVLMPLVLVYLLFDMTDVLPTLITTILLVTNFDPGRGRAHGRVVIVGNLVGGFVGLVAYLLLGIAPSLTTLALLTFLIGIGYASLILRGGPRAAITVIACNTSLIILSTAIASGPTSSGIWLARLSQLALAWIFAAGMMSLVWRRDAVGAADGD